MKNGFTIALLIAITLVSVMGYRIHADGPSVSVQGDMDFQIWKPFPFTLIVDPGHGDPDTGTISPSGVPESRINLEIGLKTDMLARFLGIGTVMTRRSESSVYDAGEITIRDKKVSDLKNRVKLVNGTENGVLLSIHQNSFEQRQYRGTQVFYRDAGSKELADAMQETVARALNPGNGRKSKVSADIYLLNNVTVPAAIIECGFLSNPQEEALLRSAEYQRKTAMAICAGFIKWSAVQP